MLTTRWVWVAAFLMGCAANEGEAGDESTLGTGGTSNDASGTPMGSGPGVDDGGDDGDDDGGSADTAVTGGDDAADTSGGPAGSSGEATDSAETRDPPADPPPTDGAALLPWLEAGTYLDWPAESGVHPSAGPHFGGVRTFLDPTLASSLEADDLEHPLGAAAVKELYGDGDQVRGWAVMVKVALGAGEDGWYWYEIYDGDVLAEGVGLGVCTGCHGSGSDYVRTPFPLQ